MPWLRVDLSPDDFVHVPQAPRIERRAIFARGPGNDWQMAGVVGVGAGGEALGLSSHTWSHLDAPFHLLADGASFDQIEPSHYLATRARVVDLTAGPAARRERVDEVEYHGRIDAEDVPDDLDDSEALLFVTGFGALYARGYPMMPGADARYPYLTPAAAERIAARPQIRLVAIDGPSVDRPETGAAAHRLLLGRRPRPVLLLETLTCERLRRAVTPLPGRVLLTAEPLRAFGPRPDGALASVYAWVAPEPADEEGFQAFAESVQQAKLIQGRS